MRKGTNVAPPVEEGVGGVEEGVEGIKPIHRKRGR